MNVGKGITSLREATTRPRIVTTDKHRYTTWVSWSPSW